MRGDAKTPSKRDEGPLVRLLDMSPGGSDDSEGSAWAVDLLREAPLPGPRPGERQRVLLGVQRPRLPVRHMWSIRVATAATALVAATTIAWAGLGHLPGWLTALSGSKPVASDTGVRVSSRANRRAPSPVAAPESLPEPSSVIAMPGDPPRPSRRRLASLEGLDRDSRLVVHAMRALRRDGDPALARGLSSTYLQRHPSGPLAEEALALMVEAAVAHQDPDAPALGARYLRQYPNGPFSGLARQASRAAAPLR